MKIIFARHGETVFGEEGRFEGLSNSPLTEKGKIQAKNLAEFCKKEGTQKIYSSPLGRSRDTSEEVSKACGLEVIFLDELKEACYGEWEGRRKTELDQEILSIRKRNLFPFVNPGSYNGIKGESYKLLFNRLSPFLKSVTEEKKNTIVVSHLGVMRCTIKYFKQIDSDTFNKLKIPNNYLYIVEFKENGLITSSALLEKEP